jgi:salicylate hydroxylase
MLKPMKQMRSRQVVVAGAGIAGMTAALAFAAHGFSVQIYERSPQLEEVGAGIQLPPNATRLLKRLGVLDSLGLAVFKPEAIALLDGRSLNPIARIPLGAFGERRWGAPYLVLHRADLQAALAAKVMRDSDIKLTLGASVKDFAMHPHGVTASVYVDEHLMEAGGLLLVGADGVWSGLRALAGKAAESRHTGDIAWRTTIRAEGPAGRQFALVADPGVVTVFLTPMVHLVTYPIRGGAAINLVAVMKGTVPSDTWATEHDPQPLFDVTLGMAVGVQKLVREATQWTAYPVHTVPTGVRWVAKGGVALIGDAAHAMTPFAAQGAAMAIEDAVSLADKVASSPKDIGAALAAWDKYRRPRVERVARRGRLNAFAWHASGPVAMARDYYLARRNPEKLASDFDWLYDWRPEPLKTNA